MALKIGSDEDAERGLKEIEQGEKQLKLDEQWKGTVLHVYPKK